MPIRRPPGAAKRIDYNDRIQHLNVDAAALAARLAHEIKGEVRFDAGSRALYATDGSNYRQVPIGVVVPRNEYDVMTTIELARQFGAPVLARGGGTSLAGQCCNVAVVMDFSKYMHEIVEIDYEHKWARVQPGVVLDDLRKAAEKRHLTYGPDPATHTHCTLGGMIGNNSCGIHALMAGKTEENVHELEVLLYDGTRMRVGPTSDDELESIIRSGGRRGEIYARLRALRDSCADEIRRRYPDIPRRVSGYNLNELLPENGFHVARALVGSECTCVTILEAKVRLVHSPPKRTVVVLGYPSVYEAGDHIPQILQFGPIGLEGIDDRLIQDMEKKGLNVSDIKLLPKGSGWLIVEFGGDSKEESDHKAREMMGELGKKSHAPSMKLYEDQHEEDLVWEIRESGLGATANVPGLPLTWPGWEDAAVPPDKVGGYLRDFRALLERYDYRCDLYGHFGQGCIHVRIDFDLFSADGVAKYRRFVHDAAHLVVSYGGSLSGEHGDGQSRAELLPIMYGDSLVNAFREFKSIWDPDWKMNPGKVVDPYRVDENLRLGADYAPWKPETHFKFPKDQDSFARATLRCVGVGKCRRLDAGVMCPSYQATREEEHSTRGRARLLFEMLNGSEVENSWDNEPVKDALDLCLACKGCKGECPVNVDMATYKAEFLSHYYEHHRRPRHAYSIGLIYWWARLASIAPPLVNFVSRTPPLSNLTKWIGGLTQKRPMPKFAWTTFRSRFEKRSSGFGEKVILWPDTFNNYFHPEVAEAAVEVLEHAGFWVQLPKKSLCCGRPLYDFGWIDRAKKLLEETMHVLQPDLERGVCIVGLEPSCVSVFRDELPNLFPNNELAKKLSSSFLMLSEFIDKHSDRFPVKKLERKAIVQGHCHHKSVLNFDAEKKLFERMNLDADVLDSGCCGLAGSFGFEPEHYDVSMKCGERLLLPTVRSAPRDTLIIADGFSCHEQILDGTGRRALHIAQVLQMAQRQGS